MSRRIALPAIVALGLFALAPVAQAATIFEVFNNTAAFDARLGQAPRIVDFDSIDTPTTDPVAFASNLFKYSHGVEIEGKGSQFVSNTFPSNITPNSLPNVYAPGPISVDQSGGGGNTSNVTFFDGVRPAQVAGFGVVFIDADNPAGGPSSFTLYDRNLAQLTSSGTVAGGDGSKIFRGIVAINDQTNQPTAVIFLANVISGDGWVGNTNNEELVALDDVRFGFPNSIAGTIGEDDEDCRNCVDDDDDGLIDRFDGECFGQASGPDGGLGDPDLGKPVTKCQKGNQKAGAKFVATKLKHLYKCLGAVAKCVQTKNGDQACLDKAAGTCAKELDKIPADEAKLVSQVEKSCGGTDFSNIEDENGLGFQAEIKPCSEFGVFSLNTATDAGECIVASHECIAEELVGHIVPRAMEYLTLAGRSPMSEFPCLPAGANGGGQGVANPDDGKDLLKCDKGLQKASIGLLKETFKAASKCTDGAAACLQLKPDDPKCLPKAEAKCDKAVDKVVNEDNGKIAKLLTKTFNTCSSSSLFDLGGAQGLGLGAMTNVDRCNELGFSVNNPITLLSCLGIDHVCGAFQMGEKQNPRLREFADRLGVDLLSLIQ